MVQGVVVFLGVNLTGKIVRNYGKLIGTIEEKSGRNSEDQT